MTIRIPIVVAAVVGAVWLTVTSVPTHAEQRSRNDGRQQEHQKHRKQNWKQHQQGEHKTKLKLHHKREQQVGRHQQRLSRQQQQQLIVQQRQRLVQYRRHLGDQRRVEGQRSAQLRQANRMAQYRFQRQYAERLRQQQLQIDKARNYNYGNDPYFHTPPSYRYLRGGNYYQTNQYGAQLLRRGVNYGYEEGFRAGQADREDRSASNYRDSYAYQDANYGYNGYYVEREDYNHYFREGFHRGYDDGYGSRAQFGSFSDGKHSVLATVLSSILNLEALR